MLLNSNEKKLLRCSWLYHSMGFGIALCLLGMVFLLTIRPIEIRRAALLERNTELNSELQRKSAVEAEHRRLSSEIARLDDQVEQMLNRIPNVPRESDFLGQITTLADEVGLAIVDYRPGGVSDQKEYKQMTLTLSSDGSYESICHFLHEIHNLPRLSRILKLDIKPNSRGATYKMEMTLTIFFSPDSQIAKA